MPDDESLPPGAGGFELSPHAFQELAEFITGHLGIKMDAKKLPMLRSRLQRRLRALGMRSGDEYRDYLLHSPEAAEELTDFIDAVTTNKTDFFRESPHFDYLVEEALPSLDHEAKRPWHVRAWCAGCSSGQEAYTLAMVLSEYGRRRGRFDFSILATDISTEMLRRAAAAIYDANLADPIPMDLRKRYLLRRKGPDGEQVRIIPELRKRVHFHRLNFMDDYYNATDLFDVVFFRNVAIYFDRETQETVARKLSRRLRLGGYLFIGHSESLLGLDLPLRMVSAAVYRAG